MKPKTLIVIPTLPERHVALDQCVGSLSSQADCMVISENPTLGSADKLRWAAKWDGVVLFCDDDLLYPPNYVETMLYWLHKFNYEVIVTCCGRILRPDAKGFKDYEVYWRWSDGTTATWLNYPGGGVLAAHTKLGLPETGVKNCEEAEIAVWAQVNRVPIFLVPHMPYWFEYLLDDDANTIWKEEVSTNFERRNSVLKRIPEWKVYDGKSDDQ